MTLLSLGGLVGLGMAVAAADAGMRLHGALVLVACALGALVLLRRRTAPAGRLPQVTTPDGEVYNDAIVRVGVVLSMFWGIVGFLVGLVLALELAWPALNLDWPWTNFGRLRPFHTSAVIFAFGGTVLLTTSFHVVQRTCRTRLAGGVAPWFVFWVVYLLVFLATLWKRKEPHIYVANWFYLAFIVTVAMLHVVNNLAVPVSPLSSKSYVLFAGVQDAMTQWWYGHNAVGFFLTAGFLGIMYYFVPKQAERPVYSYRLSIVHFWSLIFLYIWAGPHHLHYTALPDWAQTLGMTFSIMLWMPSWGGMINGLMTLSGAWDKLRTDPVIRMLVVSVAFYGMSTFEGPLMAIKAVNSLSHYTDWTIGHVHSGALGWVGFVSFGALYHLMPRLWGRPRLYSLKLVGLHFWIATIGIVLYTSAMWVSGIMQGLMWRAYDELGFLEYSFVETVEAMHPFYLIRALGGLLFVTGALIMAYNLWRTARGDLREEAVPATAPAAAPAAGA
jgi:cytochrome c oxidase cbb3-type subunit 1